MASNANAVRSYPGVHFLEPTELQYLSVQLLKLDRKQSWLSRLIGGKAMPKDPERDGSQKLYPPGTYSPCSKMGRGSPYHVLPSKANVLSMPKMKQTTPNILHHARINSKAESL